MGVDWIPCRVEVGCPDDELGELVRREALHFRTGGSSMASVLDPRVSFSDAEAEPIRRAYRELGPLYPRLLFKRESYRVSAVGAEELFPVEWRIDAERTILPWELGDCLAQWNGYREAVGRGEHRPFLQQLYIYARLHELVTVDLANFVPLVRPAVAASGDWAKRPEVVACRDELLAAPILTLPPPPRWPDGGGEADLSLVGRAFDKVESAVRAWNTAARRGNVRARLPRRPPEFESWVAARLADEGYSSFYAWAEPWRRGGYGLYRDCE